MLNAKQIPTILLLEEDNDTRGLLVENLRCLNYHVLVAVNKENIIDWVQNAVEAPDVLLVNQVKISIEEYLVMIRNLYSQTMLSPDTPTAILAEQYPNYLVGTEKQVDDNIFIVYLENAQQLFDLLDRLLNNEQ